IDECKTSNFSCPLNSTCINTAGSFTCLCSEGYTGDGMTICNDLNECEHNPAICPDHSTCVNTPGSYVCICQSGFLGAQHHCQVLIIFFQYCTADIDECISGVECHKNSVCVNTAGSYACMCKIGYKLDKNYCRDVNECQEKVNKCDSNAFCYNTDGSYICACKEGYHGNGIFCF
ncbi:hypothetical protein QZH41_012649, partial [Actinostola sp. cb2023]